MTKAQFKRRIQIVTAICILAFLSGIIILIGQLVSRATLESKKAALLEEIEKNDKELTLLEQELEYRKSAKYIEQYAREVEGMNKEGEEKFDIENLDP